MHCSLSDRDYLVKLRDLYVAIIRSRLNFVGRMHLDFNKQAFY